VKKEVHQSDFSAFTKAFNIVAIAAPRKKNHDNNNNNKKTNNNKYFIKTSKLPQRECSTQMFFFLS